MSGRRSSGAAYSLSCADDLVALVALIMLRVGWSLTPLPIRRLNFSYLIFPYHRECFEPIAGMVAQVIKPSLVPR